jgi:hypothetical protein
VVLNSCGPAARLASVRIATGETAIISDRMSLELFGIESWGETLLGVTAGGELVTIDSTTGELLETKPTYPSRRWGGFCRRIAEEAVATAAVKGITPDDSTAGIQSVLAFDGRDDYFELPPLEIDFSTGFTVEAWVRYSKFQHWSRIIDFGNGPLADYIVLANEATSANLILLVINQGSAQLLKVDGMLQADTWMHVAATIDVSGQATLYKNGQPCQSGPAWLPASTPRQQCYIGRSNWPNDAYFAGRMSELRLWNRARTAAEIQTDLHRRLSGNEAGLVGCWPLNKVNDNGLTADLTGNNHGIVRGASNADDANFPRIANDSNAAPTPLELRTGDIIALQADNGRYLTRIHRGDKDPIEAAKSGIDVDS